jgi:hypothetical protein
LLHTLAVLGREFLLRLVQRLTHKSDDELEPMLARLQGGEFIYEQPATGDIENTFKHALTQEVAYNSVLTERRKLLHQRTGQALESMFADQLEEHVTQLAHHYSHSSDLKKALHYLQLKGGQGAAPGQKYGGETRVVANDPQLLARLMPEGYDARPEQAILFTIDAWDVNCPQHIPQKFDAADVAAAVEKLEHRIGELETENARLHGLLDRSEKDETAKKHENR